MSDFGALVGAGAGLFGGLLNNIFSGIRQDDAQNFSAAQTAQQQAFNAQQAEITRQFNAQQAGVNRDFQQGTLNQAISENRYLSNTSWQRGVEDMRAAGINPILAYEKGGASSPSVGGMSGSAASGPAASASAASGHAAQVFDMVAPVIASAKAIEEVKNLAANRALTEQQTRTDSVRAGAIASEAGLAEQRTRVGKTEEERNVKQMPVYEAAGSKAAGENDFYSSKAGRLATAVGAGAQTTSQVLKPVGDVVDMAMGLKRLGTRRMTEERTDDRGNSSFTERFNY